MTQDRSTRRLGLALMLAVAGILQPAGARAASGGDVHVDLSALDQMGFTRERRPDDARPLVLTPPGGQPAAARRGPSAAPVSAAAPPAATAPAATAPPVAAPAVAARSSAPAAAAPERPARAAASPAAPPPPSPSPAPPKQAAPATAPPPRDVAAATATPAPPARPAPTAPAPAQPTRSRAAPPAPVVAPPPTPAAPSQTAALPPPAVAQRRGEARVSFPAGGTDLPSSARSELDRVAGRLAADEALRLQLNAYAAGEGEQSSQARRLSLSRALAVRAYLIDKGVRSTRLDVRALGQPQDDGPADRVDLVVVGR
ncbi:hypothetical protein STAQ_45260 [Allostella sp. ATCC 35155]|nr:hypothetical protein STAQ_45260 [Stella sp. ATCC 35155]